MRVADRVTLLLEIQGEEGERRGQARAARRWVSTVNWRVQPGRWVLPARQDPQRAIDEIWDLCR